MRHAACSSAAGPRPSARTSARTASNMDISNSIDGVSVSLSVGASPGALVASPSSVSAGSVGTCSSSSSADADAVAASACASSSTAITAFGICCSHSACSTALSSSEVGTVLEAPSTRGHEFALRGREADTIGSGTRARFPPVRLGEGRARRDAAGTPSAPRAAPAMSEAFAMAEAAAVVPALAADAAKSRGKT